MDEVQGRAESFVSKCFQPSGGHVRVFAESANDVEDKELPVLTNREVRTNAAGDDLDEQPLNVFTQLRGDDTGCPHMGHGWKGSKEELSAG